MTTTTVMQTTALLHPLPDTFDVKSDVLFVSDVIHQMACDLLAIAIMCTCQISLALSWVPILGSPAPG
ncbi:hypothetical protein D6D13_10613 [Aureobasidium pullulans]|uniref:Uncharacterized protein n=1 Tax=Aureobasidium pullulans TaxID=5580 RepID=A0A4S9BX29_AURPU|nr:hypothetical protein D6D13_10613 [Aureobasidium pullulans]